ncbi:MAG: hypothetical protein OHK0057_07880 [Thermoflexibacter sp.]
MGIQIEKTLDYQIIGVKDAFVHSTSILIKFRDFICRHFVNLGLNSLNSDWAKIGFYTMKYDVAVKYFST